MYNRSKGFDIFEDKLDYNINKGFRLFSINERFQIDRIETTKCMNEKFHIPYKDRFNEGEFRKRVHFMYSGPFHRITFEYRGQSIESVLDRLPTAEIISKDDEKCVIHPEVYGDGIEMWIRSQGNNIMIL